MRQRELVFKTLSYLFLTVASLIMVYPLVYMLLGAFTTMDQYVDARWLPIPNTLNLNLFVAAFNSGIGQAYLVTLVRVAWSLCLTLGVGLTGGYVFSKLDFPYKNRGFLVFLAGMVVLRKDK